MAWEARWGLKLSISFRGERLPRGLNGLGSPLGIETDRSTLGPDIHLAAKWPGKPVGD